MWFPIQMHLVLFTISQEQTPHLLREAALSSPTSATLGRLNQGTFPTTHLLQQSLS